MRGLEQMKYKSWSLTFDSKILTIESWEKQMKSPLIPPKGDNFDPKQFQLNLCEDYSKKVLSETANLLRTNSF